MEEFASSISEFISLSNLEVSLRYVFSKVNTNLNMEMPNRNDILQGLLSLKITEENYEDIERVLADNLEWTIERLFPVIIALNKGKDVVQIIKERLFAIQNEEQLLAIINEYIDNEIDSGTLIDFGKQVKNDREMGQILYRDLKLELIEWNNALISAGDKYKRITQIELVDEFKEYKNEYKNLIISILRQKCKKDNNIKQYEEDKKSFESMDIKDCWLEEFWELKKPQILNQFGQWLNERNVNINIVNVFNISGEYQELEDNLSSLIDDLKISYFEIDTTNRKLIQKSISDIRRTVITYLHKNNIEISTFWMITDINLFEEFMEDIEEGALELSLWDEKLAYEKIFTGNAFSHELKAIKEIKQTPESYDQLLSHFNILQEELQDAIPIIEKQNENRLKEKRLVKIKDVEFDTEDSNLYNLVDVIANNFKDGVITNGSIENPNILKSLKGKTKIQGGNPHENVKRSAPTHVNKNIEAAIGLSGEIIANNELLKEYGKAYTPDCWKSNNRRYVFQGNSGDDSLGYDFELLYKKKTYHIEVKTTSGDGLQFEMGSSETRQAIEDAKRRNIVYRILFITRVFEKPTLYWLPNPFSNESSGFYSIRDAGARISFNIIK